MRMANLRRNVPQNLPGDFGTAEALQAFNSKRKYSVGFHFQVKSGSNTFDQIKFPGTARMLLGLVVFDDTADPLNILTVDLNNEKIIDEDSWIFYTNASQFTNAAGQVIGSSYKDEYYFYPRALSGTDSFKITYLGNTAGNLFISFKYKTQLDANFI